MEKLLITCYGDGPLHSYVSNHHNFKELHSGEYESINGVDAYAAITWLISQYRPKQAGIMRRDSDHVELCVIEDK